MEQNTVNKYMLIAVTMTANFFTPLMGAAINIALPEISNDFSMNAVGMSWVTLSYLLSSAVFLVPSGKLGDMLGRRKLFLMGNIFFLLSTLLCGVSQTSTMLIVARVMQGISSAMMISTSMAMVISAFPPKERGKAIGMNVSAVYVGLSIAPVLGGVLTETFGWRSLFYISTFTSLIIVLLILLTIKAEWTEAKNDKFDWQGTLIYIPSMSILMYGFSKLPTLPAIMMTILGLLGLILFILHERKTEFPVLNMKLFFENKVFASTNLSAFINYAATYAVSFVLSLYLQYAKHLSPKDAGMVLITQPVFMAMVALFSGRLSDKVNPRLLASSGMAISVAGLIMLALLKADTSQNFIILSLAILGFGFGFFSSPNTNLLMSSVEKKYYGVASATVSTMRSTGMMFSMAIASLSVHVFIGNEQISDMNISAFIKSANIVFWIFSAFCIAGVFLSLVKKKN